MARRFVEVDGKGKVRAAGHSREILGLVLCGFSLFGLVALASYRQTPLGEPVRNICGVLGDRLAFTLHMLFGQASFVLVVYMACWGALLVARRAGGAILARLLGILSLTLVVALVLSLHLDLKSPLAAATNTAALPITQGERHETTPEPTAVDRITDGQRTSTAIMIIFQMASEVRPAMK